MGEIRTTIRLRTSTGLRAKLVRAMVVTLVVVAGATVLTVGYMNYPQRARDAGHHRDPDPPEHHAQGAGAGHQPRARAARAWSPTTRSATWPGWSSDRFAKTTRWCTDCSWAPTAAPGPTCRRRRWAARPGSAPTSGSSASIPARGDPARRGGAPRAVVAGQEAFEFSASVAADDGAVLGRIFYGLSSVPLDAALSAARQRVPAHAAADAACCCRRWASWRPCSVSPSSAASPARITRPLAHLTEVTTAIADGRKNQRVSIASDDEIGDAGARLQPDAARARRFVLRTSNR